MLSGPVLRGGLLALLAAALFGISTPLVQSFGTGLGPLTTAAMLYAGAALVGALLRRPVHAEAALVRADGPRLLAMAFFGAVVGPVALAWGLQRTSGTSASLMLSLEAFFTALLAWRLYHETMDKRVWTAMALLLAGGVALIVDQGTLGALEVAGLLAVLLATAAWGVDNSLSRALADKDPGQVVLYKAALGAACTGALAWLASEPLPTATAALALLAIGATGYGLSLRFYLLAQRTFGAGRTGSVFSFAPFIGAAVAIALGERSVGMLTLLGGVLMVAGVVLHLAESHGHGHQHDALEHEHAHIHDDGHHGHSHGHDPDQSHDQSTGKTSPSQPPPGSHSHWHRHEPQQHTHAHAPDAHHQHRH
jgi:drug/metabolite transporter (DMT)-like permease